MPASLATDVWDRNLFGLAVGDYEGADQNIYGYTLRNGVFETINFPGSFGSTLRGVNNLGVIVGYGFNADDSLEHGFIQIGNRYRQVDYPGASFTELGRINDYGTIVGFEADADFVGHSFILTNACGW